MSQLLFGENTIKQLFSVKWTQVVKQAIFEKEKKVTDLWETNVQAKLKLVSAFLYVVWHNL